MTTYYVHFMLNLDRAVEIQRRLRTKVILQPPHVSINLIGACDVSFKSQFGVAVCATFNLHDLTLVETAHHIMPTYIPYVPGLLSFRELPFIIRTLLKLQRMPDLLLVDGHGIAHPRRFGLASHIGVVLNIPSIGCAKSCLIGEYNPPNPTRGAYSWLYDDGEKIGLVIRTATNVNPIFVSPGHKVDFTTAYKFILRTTKHRIPEPLRYVDIASRKIATESI